MTLNAALGHAPYSDGHRVFHETLRTLAAAGWTRLRVDTFTREDHDWVVRHHFDAGCWELHFERAPAHQRDRWNSMPLGSPSRVARINLRRPPLPTAAQVLSQLFGPHMHLARPRASDNGLGAITT